MSEQKLDRMEEMLSQLVTTVGSLKGEMTEMKNENERNHAVVMDKLRNIEVDQDHIWEKSVRNEREIAKLKQKN
jgi:regulator of replication initiation timing